MTVSSLTLRLYVRGVGMVHGADPPRSVPLGHDDRAVIGPAGWGFIRLPHMHNGDIRAREADAEDAEVT